MVIFKLIIIIINNQYLLLVVKSEINYLLFFSSVESRTIVECDGDDNFTNRVVADDDEDEREDVASV